MVKVSRFEVWLVNLDPTLGREIQKTRSCVVVSPDDLNRVISTVIIAPLTSGGRSYKFRVPSKVKGKTGQVLLDQIRTVDRVRLIKRIDKLDPSTADNVMEVLQNMFAP
jgi:mRNA interferase MazF